MASLSLKLKLAIGFGALMLTIILLGIFGYWSAQTTEKNSETVKFNSTKKDLSMAVQIAIEMEKVGGRDALLNGKSETLKAARAEYALQTDQLRPLLSSPESHKLFQSTMDANQEYAGYVDRSIELKQAGKTEQALEVFYGADAQRARTDLKHSTSGLVDWYEKLKSDADDQQAASDLRGKWLFVTLALAGIVVGLVVSLAVTVTKDVAGNIAQASVGVRDANDRVSQTAEVSRSIARDIAGVNAALTGIRQGGEDVQASAAELSKLAEKLGAQVAQFKV